MSATMAACGHAQVIQRLLRQRLVNMRSERQAIIDLGVLFFEARLVALQGHHLGLKAQPSFFLPGSGLAIEVAAGGVSSSLAYERLQRCAKQDEAHALLLVAPSVGQLGQTVDIAGKPFFTATVRGHA